MKTAKFKFVTAHLIISICVAAVAACIVFFCWYPFPLNKAVGVTHIFLMMLGIDIVLGPFFTWLVYKEGKKSLKFDLTVIIAIQISALLYGIYSIERGRPAWLAYNVDRFELVRKNEIVDQNINQAKPKFQQVSWFKPQYVAVNFAKDIQQRNDDMFAEALGGISLAQRPERYVNFAEAKAQLQKRAQSLELLPQYNDKAVVKNILAKYPQATAFLPMKASAVDMTVLINHKGGVVKIVDLRPWQ